MEYGFDLQLSDKELCCIGAIIALWASLEHEIFYQTLTSFGDPPQGPLPSEMNNIKFSQVLALWESRVVNRAVGNRKAVLQKQLDKIRHNYDFRNALAHGMWNWSIDSPDRITATRVRKDQVISVHFTADDLASFASDLETMNFQVRCPGGLDEYANAAIKEGSYISRRAFSMMTSEPSDDTK